MATQFFKDYTMQDETWDLIQTCFGWLITVFLVIPGMEMLAEILN